MATVNVNGQSYEVQEEIAEAFSNLIRRVKSKEERIDKLNIMINEAIEVVHRDDELSMGYDVLCALGVEC